MKSLALHLFIFLFITRFSNAELILYSASGTVTSALPSHSHLLNKPYTIKLIYPLDLRGSGFYSEGTLAASLEIDSSTYYIEESGDLRVLQGNRFEQNFTAYQREFDPSLTSEGLDRLNNSEGLGCELILQDNDRVFPVSTSPPTTLNLDDFEFTILHIYDRGQVAEATIENISFTPMKCSELYNITGPFFEIQTSSSSATRFDYRTYWKFTPGFEGLPFRAFSSVNLNTWLTREIGTLAFGADIELDSDKRTRSLEMPWPRLEKEFFTVVHPTQDPR